MVHLAQSAIISTRGAPYVDQNTRDLIESPTHNKKKKGITLSDPLDFYVWIVCPSPQI